MMEADQLSLAEKRSTSLTIRQIGAQSQGMKPLKIQEAVLFRVRAELGGLQLVR
jgi:hypothetical protein